MSTIAIFPESPMQPKTLFRAVSGAKQFIAASVGEAVVGLTQELGEPQETTLVIIQPMKSDQFFTQSQQNRLALQMTRWRAAGDGGIPLTNEEQQELTQLVHEETQAATLRAKSLLADRQG
jgi:phenylpyruvate tautomerase PptA (4-oxalocrotonate tautomerase family)